MPALCAQRLGAVGAARGLVARGRSCGPRGRGSARRRARSGRAAAWCARRVVDHHARLALARRRRAGQRSATAVGDGADRPAAPARRSLIRGRARRCAGRRTSATASACRPATTATRPGARRARRTPPAGGHDLDLVDAARRRSLGDARAARAASSRMLLAALVVRRRVTPRRVALRRRARRRPGCRWTARRGSRAPARGSVRVRPPSGHNSARAPVPNLVALDRRRLPDRRRARAAERLRRLLRGAARGGARRRRSTCADGRAAPSRSPAGRPRPRARGGSARRRRARRSRIAPGARG